MRKTLFFSILQFIFLPAFTQSTFNFQYGTLIDSEFPQFVRESNADEFIAAVEMYHNPNKQHLNSNSVVANDVTSFKMIKFDTLGNLLKEKEFPNRGLTGFLNTAYGIYCIGIYQETADSLSVFSMLLNSDFDILIDKKYRIPDFDKTDGLWFWSPFIERNDTIYTIINRENKSAFTFISNTDCDSIKSETMSNFVRAIDIENNPNGKGFLITGGFGSSGPGISIGFATKELHIYNSMYPLLPMSGFVNANISALNRNQFVISGFDFGYSPDFNSQISVGIFDTTMTNFAHTKFGKSEFKCYSAETNGLVVDSLKNIYAGGTVHYVYSAIQDFDNWIVVGKTDSLLNKKWEKFYGGDAYYCAEDMSLCRDGGVIVSATRYDYNVDGNQYNAYFFKVDSAGNGPLSSVNGAKPLKVSEIIVFPNPGASELFVRTAVQRVGGEFEMSDIAGRIVLSQKIISEETVFKTQDLPSGIYVFKYTWKGKLIETGKWIKSKK